MVFRKLRLIQQFERTHFDFLRSREDRDLVISIGYGQETGNLMSFKHLLLERIATPSTLQRRLNRLVQKGVVIRTSDATDRRATLYTLAPDSIKLFKRFDRTCLSGNLGGNETSK